MPTLTSPRYVCTTPDARARGYLCRHLASGASGLGVCYDVASRSPWPDLRCEACRTQAPRQRQALRPVCGFCWDEAFGKNYRVRNAGGGSFLSSCVVRGRARQDRWVDRHRISSLTRWVLDLEARCPRLGLGLPEEDCFQVVGEPIVIGSWDPHGGDWLWGWANDSLRVSHYRGVVRLKRFGERCGIEPLWRSRSRGQEALALQLSMVALDATPSLEGVYRVVQPNGTIIFLGVKNTRSRDGV